MRRRNGYRFLDKNPIIDAARYAFEQSNEKLIKLSQEARISPSTPKNWFEGETRNPQHGTIQKFMQACGFEEVWRKSHSSGGLKVNYERKRGSPSFRIIRK